MFDISSDKNKNDTPAVTETEQPAPSGKDNKGKSVQKRNPVRRITLIVLAVCLFLFVWCLVADRLTPSTDQADIRGVNEKKRKSIMNTQSILKLTLQA